MGGGGGIEARSTGMDVAAVTGGGGGGMAATTG